MSVHCLPGHQLLPACAWAADVRGGESRVVGGARVERLGDMIVEGAWAGELTAEGALGSPFRCASGAILGRRRLRLLAPTHSIEAVYCYIERDFSRIVASNSPHLMVALAPEADPGQGLGEARTRAGTLKLGMSGYDRFLWKTAGGLVYRFAWGVVEIDLDRRELLTETALLGPSPFSSYAEYRAHLSATIAGVVDNARDGARAAPFGRLVTTCSTGYDSAACAVLAAELGCREAVTLTSARGGRDDSGAAIAAQLGLSCQEYPRFGAELEVRDDQRKDHFVEAGELPVGQYEPFLGELGSAEDLAFTPFAPDVAGAVLLTGFHGDKVWNVACSSGPDIVRGDNSGTGLAEFRKRLGFINLVAPFIGARFSAEIGAISRSEEMAPYRLDRHYDRPIPRRMVEERGIPRRAFGWKKGAGSVLLNNAGPRRDAAFTALVSRYRALTAGVEAAS